MSAGFQKESHPLPMGIRTFSILHERGYYHVYKMSLSKRQFDCGGCGVSLDRDVTASRNILRQACLLAGWEMGQESALPGASENVRHHVVALAGQDAEQYIVT